MSTTELSDAAKAAKREYMRQWRDANREKIAANRKRYYMENREAELERARKYRESHPDYHANWQRENRDRFNAYHRMRYAKKKEAPK